MFFKAAYYALQDHMTVLLIKIALTVYIYVCLVSISYTDIRSYRIPDAWVLALAAAGFAVMSGIAGPHPNAVRCLISALLPPAAYVSAALLCALLGKTMPFGLGDAKLLSAMALIGGWNMLAFTYVLASLAAGAFSVLKLAAGKANKKDRIAFGPFLSFAFMLCWTSALAATPAS